MRLHQGMMEGQIWMLKDGRGILPFGMRLKVTMMQTAIGAIPRQEEFGTPEPQLWRHRTERTVLLVRTHLRHQRGHQTDPRQQRSPIQE